MRTRLYVVLSTCFLTVLSGTIVRGTDRAPANSASVDQGRIQDIADKIDELVLSQLQAHEQRPNRSIDDETFLRRIYLDVVGRIPTLEESRQFLESRDRKKRSKLIDKLLESEGYASHHFNIWADVLRTKSRLQGGNPGQPYIEYLKNAISTNVKYDEFVRELLTSTGSILDPENGATGYYLRDQGMPEDNMANTARIFLGTRLECAQCHDHPFDKWTQREFFEMVAFNGGMQTRLRPTGMNSMGNLRQKLRNVDAPEKVKQLAANLVRPLSYGVAGGGTGLARLPDSYQYDDGKPNEIVTAKTLFEHESLVHPTIPVSRNPKRKRRNNRQRNSIPNAEDIGSRDVFADWLTSHENPRFTMVIANRLWKQTMGLGLIEPVDDINDETVASNQKLLDYLSEQMVSLDYDMKQFYRAIYNSKTYQREASDADVSDPTEYYFPGPMLRRMTAEQLWDSFLTLAVPELDSRENPRSKVMRYGVRPEFYRKFAETKTLSVNEVIAMAEQELEMRQNPDKRKERFRDMMQSSSKTKYDVAASEIKSEVGRLKKAQVRARKQKRFQVVRVLNERIQRLQTQLRHMPARVGPDLVRASELASPAPPGHFLREFGQSDRDQIENANSEPAVSQVLSLMNGQIEKRIISNPRTVLMQNIVQAGSVHDKIDVIFLSMLSRHPTSSESRMWKRAAATDGAEAANDLIWTLANASEFMFIR